MVELRFGLRFKGEWAFGVRCSAFGIQSRLIEAKPDETEGSRAQANGLRPKTRRDLQVSFPKHKL